ncbi:ABC transporter permease [Agreia pratensis]|uniref:Putative ABC transport system permease protein n=1 Tax=Agreia pratensis TaxID=150121 RepID=A0A1X7K219_9MICO|nr:ABC transporter permease [Agreia pratensis]SMG34584.1 putative ABC transport system permease protein [Agreia pratensis]
MSGLDMIRSAVGNTFRSKTRTILTVLAIFIGAFTLALTSGVGTGINRYIDTTVSSIGSNDIMVVTRTAENTSDGPAKYEPDTRNVASQTASPGTTVRAITTGELDDIAGVSGVTSVDPALAIRPDYVEYNGGTQYQVSFAGFPGGTKLNLAAGADPAPGTSKHEVAIPVEYVDALGFTSDSDAVGKTVTFGVTDQTGGSTTIDATIVGVAQPGLVGTSSLTANDSLTKALYDAQSVGLSDASKNSYASVTVHFDPSDSDAQISTIKGDLKALGYDATTVKDQIGLFKTIIDAIVLVLNGFAVIALVAAGFGIVNTLLMSVQERTREIGLMKAMGMGGGRVFGLFSLEAVFIGFLGSAIGVIGAILAGTALNGVLANGLLSALPGLSLIAFDPAPIAVIILVVMSIAFLAGTIPALRAARQDPIESLRYE